MGFASTVQTDLCLLLLNPTSVVRNDKLGVLSHLLFYITSPLSQRLTPRMLLICLFDVRILPSNKQLPSGQTTKPQ